MRIISSQNKKQDNNLNNTEQNSRKSIKYYIFKIMNDFTFLFGKIVGYIPFHCVRMFLYRYVFCIRIGQKAVIHYGLEFRSPWNIKIGNYSIIGDHCILDGRFGIEILDNVNFSTGVWIWTLQHDVNSPYFSSDGQEGKVTVNSRAWLSSRTCVLPGCTIGEGCVLAAGAILCRGTSEPFSIYGGIPAKKIANRNENLEYQFSGEHRYFL